MGDASAATNTPGHLTNFLTKYERTKVIGVRAEQLARGAQALVDLPEGVQFHPYEVAERELLSRKLPLVLQRTMPDGKTELFKLENMKISQ